MSDQLVRLLHEWEIAKLPHTYGRAVDRRDKAALGELFTSDALFERDPKPPQYYEDIVAIPRQEALRR